MSWSNKKIYGFILGSLLAGSALVGCGGDATVGPNPGTPVVPANGGVPQNNGVSNEGRAAAANPQQVQVTVNGNAQQAWLPAGIPIVNGQQVAVFTPNQQVLVGLGPIGRAPGDIRVRPHGVGEYQETGVHLTSDGRLSGFFILPNGTWDVLISGPLRISRNGNTLDVRQLLLTGDVNNGVASVPVDIQGELPINGGTTVPLRLDIQMPAPFSNGFVDLRVLHDNGALSQERMLSNGHAQFRDLVSNGASSQIPAVGVNSVEFRYHLLGDEE